MFRIEHTVSKYVNHNLYEKGNPLDNTKNRKIKSQKKIYFQWEGRWEVKNLIENNNKIEGEGVEG